MTIIFILCTGSLIAQSSKNIFLNREFWKSNPTVETVKQKIAEKNSPTALNSYGFDAVVYAMLEKANNKVIKYLLSLKGNEVNKLTHDKRTYVFWAAYVNNLNLMKHLIANKARMDLKDSHHFSVATFAAATGQTNTKIYDLCIQQGIELKDDTDKNGANALLLIAPYLKDLSLTNYFVSKGVDLHSKDNNGNGLFNYAAKGGNKGFLEKIISKGISPPKELNKKGENALFLATKYSWNKGYNSLDYLKHLESYGLKANITTSEGLTPLHNLAYSNKDVKTFDYFLSKGVSANQKDKEGNTALINAAEKNDLPIVELLAEKTQNINHKNKEGLSALSKAVKGNNIEVIEYLLKKGADVKVVDYKGNTLAYYLVKSYTDKNKEVFTQKKKLLAKKGLRFQTAQEKNNSLFHIAIEKNSVNLLKEISLLNIDLNSKNKDGLTALHKAVMQAENTKLIKYLLSIGADKAITTDFGETVYELAEENEILSSQNIDISFLK